MLSYVLDTSIFTNPDTFTQFGSDSQEAILVFLDLARQTGARFYIPSTVYNELQLIKNLETVKPQFESVVRIRSPRRYNILIPSEILYAFIDEIRQRIDRGLRVSEEHARLAHKTLESEDPGKLIARLREKYRETLRQGILDSREDADVLMLAYELEGVIVSADEGLRKWADRVGIMMVDPKIYRKVLENLIKNRSSSEEVS